MTKKKSNEDIVDVAGLRKSDVILQVGNNIPFLSKFVSKSSFIKEVSDVPYTDVYDKIFVNTNEINETLVAKLACINTGIIVFTDLSKHDSDVLEDVLSTTWYPANVWRTLSSVGHVLMTDAIGPGRSDV